MVLEKNSVNQRKKIRGFFVCKCEHCHHTFLSAGASRYCFKHSGTESRIKEEKN